MTAAAPALDLSGQRSASWPSLLREIFAPTPGRFNATIRIVVATAIVLATSMTLEVPSIALSLFIVIYLTKLTSGVTTQNSVVVAVAGAAAIVVLTLAVALTILIFRFTFDQPPLRLAAMALFFFLGMFMQRVFAVEAVGFIGAIVVLVTQAYVDLFPGPESAVRGVLWVWVVLVYPVVITIGINLLLLPADPEPLLRREAAGRLRALARLIRAPRGSTEAASAGASLAAFAAQGSAPLLRLLRLAEVRDSSLEPLRTERTAKIQLLERLVELGALLANIAAEPSPGQKHRLDWLAAECERYASAVSTGTLATPGQPPASAETDDPHSPLTPILAELERIISELPVAERPVSDQSAGSRGPFVADAFTNPRYAQFALKVTLAAMLCYVAYTAVDWNGIHTCMITCVIVALGSAGATIHKATLRLIGCAIGGGLALASIVFLVPHMTSIVALMLLVAAVIAPAAWIAMGNERTAYLGVQLAFTFGLAVLQGYEPSTDVTEFRDRFVGVVFGVTVMALVFAYVWPERAGDRMRQSLVAALRRMSELALGPGDRRLRAAAWHSIDEADQLSGLYAFEPEAYTPRGAEHYRWMERLLDLTRRVLLAQAAIDRLYEAEAAARTEATADPARTALRHTIAAAFAGVADRIETGTAAEHTSLRTALAALAAARSSADVAGTPLNGALALFEELVERVEVLEQAAASA